MVRKLCFLTADQAAGCLFCEFYSTPVGICLPVYQSVLSPSLSLRAKRSAAALRPGVIDAVTQC